MTWTPSQLPDKVESCGFVYVVSFDTGMVKIGYTATPRARLVQHRDQGRSFGVTLTGIWISNPYRVYKEIEQSLKAAIAAWTGGSPRREYLTDIPLDDVMALVRGLGARGKNVVGTRSRAIPRQRTAPRRLAVIAKPGELDRRLSAHGLHTAVERGAALALDREAYLMVCSGEMGANGYAVARAMNILRADFADLFHVVEAVTPPAAPPASQPSLFEAVSA